MALPRTPILTARLSLEPVDLTHDEGLLQAIQCSRDDLLPWMPWAVSPTMTLQHQFRDESLRLWEEGREYDWAMVEGGRPLGVIGINILESGEGEIHYWISSEGSGRGLTTEAAEKVLDFAFGTLQLKRVLLNAGNSNAGSLRIAKKLGFTSDGALEGGMEGGLGRFDATRHRLAKDDWRGKLG